METTSAHDLILSIKRAIETQGLSFQDVKNLLAEEDVYPADTTLRRLLKHGSENNDSFNFEGTLRPIARVLVDNIPAQDDVMQAQLDLYRELCLYKHEQIESLHKQIEHLKEEHAMRCRKCEEKTSFLQEQIKLKDKRMDEQAARFDEQTRRMDKLMDKLLEKV